MKSKKTGPSRYLQKVWRYSFESKKSRIRGKNCAVKLLPIRRYREPEEQSQKDFKNRVVQSGCQWAGALDKQWTSYKMPLELGQLIDILTLKDELVCYKNRIYIPHCKDLKLTVTSQPHDANIAGHFGRDKTLELLTRNYYWPNLYEWVKTFVKTCDACPRNQTIRRKKYGRLQPLEIHYRPWEHISMDFITDLRKVNGYDQIWVIVDRFTKMAHFIPLKK